MHVTVVTQFSGAKLMVGISSPIFLVHCCFRVVGTVFGNVSDFIVDSLVAVKFSPSSLSFSFWGFSFSFSFWRCSRFSFSSFSSYFILAMLAIFVFVNFILAMLAMVFIIFVIFNLAMLAIFVFVIFILAMLAMFVSIIFVSILEIFVLIFIFVFVFAVGLVDFVFIAAFVFVRFNHSCDVVSNQGGVIVITLDDWVPVSVAFVIAGVRVDAGPVGEGQTAGDVPLVDKLVDAFDDLRRHRKGGPVAWV
jgi:hypothetical protein